MQPPSRPQPENMVAIAAKAITRRRALRNAGTVALGAALTTAYFGTRPETTKAACTFSNICGPSPICGSTRCQSPHPNEYKCKPSTTTKWSVYAQHKCSGDAGVKNCWSICHLTSLWYCCDCCAKNAGCTTNAQVCSGCGSSGWTTCICYDFVANC
jgi:hypothetical protein